MIYCFHMPAFMALSGVLFYASFQSGKYKDLRSITKEKARRLLIPYFLVGCLYSFPIKYLSGFYSESKDLFHDFILGQVLIRDDTHLWYLLTLFIVFVIVYSLEKYLPGHMPGKIAVLYCLFEVNRLMGWRWQSPMEMTLWFYVGYCFAARKGHVSRKKTFGQFFAAFAVFIAIVILRKRLDIPLFEKPFLLPGTILSGIYTVYLFSVWLSGTKLTENRLFKLLLRDSFGIYLYSDPLNYAILYVAFSLFGSSVFTDSIMFFGLYLFRIAFTLTAALGITEMLRKAKVKYLY